MCVQQIYVNTSIKVINRERKTYAAFVSAINLNLLYTQIHLGTYDIVTEREQSTRFLSNVYNLQLNGIFLLIKISLTCDGLFYSIMIYVVKSYAFHDTHFLYDGIVYQK